MADNNPVTFDFKKVAEDFSKLPESVRKHYAQVLYDKNLYNGPITGKLNTVLSDAFVSAAAQAQQRNATYGSNFTIDSYLSQLPDQTSGTGQPRRQKLIDYQISDAGTAARLVNAVFANELGRKATKQELAKYTSMIQAAQAKTPQVTTYDGINTQVRTTTGGVNPEQMLIEQIAGTDEAKANRASNFYALFKQAIGVQ
jgi:hypothetical protein